jgi:hypothetical protein
LMGPHGCKQNPRRVMALEKNKGGNKGIPSWFYWVPKRNLAKERACLECLRISIGCY